MFRLSLIPVSLYNVSGPVRERSQSQEYIKATNLLADIVCITEVFYSKCYERML